MANHPTKPANHPKLLPQSTLLVFEQLVAGLRHVGDTRELDSSPGVFRPVHVRCLDFQPGRQALIEVEHPQTTDGRQRRGIRFCASLYGNRVAAAYPYSEVFSTAEVVHVNPEAPRANPSQADLVDAVHEWLRTVASQQGL